jgi:hypothetical protein
MKHLFKLISIFKKYAYNENDFVLPSIQKKYLQIIKKLEQKNIELTFIPDVVSHFEQIGIPQSEIKEKLLQLSKQNLIELRPESGLDRLTKEETQKCIIVNLSQDKYILSWIRIV